MGLERRKNQEKQGVFYEWYDPRFNRSNKGLILRNNPTKARMRSIRFFIYPVFKMAYSLFILTIKMYTLETIFYERVAQNVGIINTYRIFII